MTKEILQIENTNTLDFKNEILNGVSDVLKSFASTLQTNNHNILLTREETSKLLRVSLVTLWAWTRKDIIPAYRIGNQVRYKRNEVLDALRQMNKFNSQ
jgi:excisionase family DNA binding protein